MFTADSFSTQSRSVFPQSPKLAPPIICALVLSPQVQCCSNGANLDDSGPRGGSSCSDRVAKRLACPRSGRCRPAKEAAFTAPAVATRSAACLGCGPGYRSTHSQGVSMHQLDSATNKHLFQKIIFKLKSSGLCTLRPPCTSVLCWWFCPKHWERNHLTV